MIKLSRAGKMPCRSWSLQAIETCPASIGSDGELVDACKGCYATTGNYRFPNVKAPRIHNKEDWKRDEWAADMIAELDNDRYFRWFDSGDVYALGLAKKIYEICKATPWASHWIPTRMHKFPKFAKILAELNALPNVVVRFSSDSVTGEKISGEYTSTIVADADTPTSATMCRAYANDGKCGSCRKCWSKSISVIAYPAHGKSMKKLIKTLQVVAA
jgi:hypothetical protein|tara:strand:+ start:1496 stop:2143 length:648 start_codon:yes stop_codon:yes gene_type:complete